MGAVKAGVIFKGVAINGYVVSGMAKTGVVFYKAKVLDADVEAFITKAGIVSEIEIQALNTYIVSLKRSGLLSRMRVIYPMLGSSANSTKFDFMSKNNGKFDIDWYGGLTFSSMGVKGNGVNGYGNTKFNPALEFTDVTKGWGTTICVGTNLSESNNKQSMGAYGSENASFSVTFRNNQIFTYMNKLRIMSPTSNNFGIMTSSKINNDAFWKVNAHEDNYTDTGVNPSLQIYLLTTNISIANPLSYTTLQRVQSALIHEGLTNQQTRDLQIIINQFEKDLGRKTW